VNAPSQVTPQSIPAGELVTVPAPDPDLATVKARPTRKVAETVVLESSLTEHDPVPEQPPPDQPVNADPDWACAVRVTVVPLL
jgi:hypothetical protein